MLNAKQAKVANFYASLSKAQTEALKADAANTFNAAIQKMESTNRKSMSRAEFIALIRSTAQ